MAGVQNTVEACLAEASNPGTEPNRLQQLARDDHWIIQEAVASNPSAPSNTLVQLGRSTRVKVREAVASNEAAPNSVLHWLSRDVKNSIRERVAMHPLCPPDVLASLAKDSHAKVRGLVASHPNTDEEVMGYLEADALWSVRQALIDNPNLPVLTCLRLAMEDPDPLIGDYALKRVMQRSIIEWTLDVKDRGLTLSMTFNEHSLKSLADVLIEHDMLTIYRQIQSIESQWRIECQAASMTEIVSEIAPVTSRVSKMRL